MVITPSGISKHHRSGRGSPPPKIMVAVPVEGHFSMISSGPGSGSP